MMRLLPSVLRASSARTWFVRRRQRDLTQHRSVAYLKTRSSLTAHSTAGIPSRSMTQIALPGAPVGNG